ncbi:MAG: zinc-dependent alcohol dehydrogenase [Planctomycetota bacterium]
MSEGSVNRQILLEAPGAFGLREGAVPQPGPGEALVRIHCVGVCGSDIHLYRHGRIGDIALEEPLVIGHEAAGEVVDVGAGAPEGLVGKRVAVEPHDYCGKCRSCAAGNTNMCRSGRFLGLPPTPGAMQEYLVHPAKLLIPLSDDLDDRAAVALEPMSIALHAVNLAKVPPGGSVAVLGTGVIGTCVIALLSLHDGLEIVCADLMTDRLERVRAMGVSTTVTAVEGARERAASEVVEALGGEGAGIVFECAGVPDTLWNMCEVAAPGAHVAVIGSNPEDTVAFSSGSARRKGLTMRFVRRSLNTLGSVMELASKGLLKPGDIVTHTFGARKAAEAYETVAARADGVLKAVVDMRRW